MKKRILSILLSLCMLCSLFPVTAGAEDNHSHPICGAACRHTTAHESVTWTPIGTVDELTGIEEAGYYYLTTSIDLGYDTWMPVNGVVLDLHGNTLSSTVSYMICLGSNVEFTVTNCQGTGNISHTYSSYIESETVSIGSNISGAVFNLYNGTISSNGYAYRDQSGNEFNQYGGTLTSDNQSCPTVFVQHNGEYNLFGGSVTKTNSSNSAIAVDVRDSAKLTMSGDVAISGPVGILVTNPITIAGGLAKPSAPYTIYTANTNLALSYFEFTEGWDTYMQAAKPTDYFAATTHSSGYAPVKQQSGELMLAEPPAVEPHTNHCICGGSVTTGEHSHDDSAPAWTAWDGTDEITYNNNVAYVCLSGDVNRTSQLAVGSGETLNLCLNGNSITLTGSNNSTYGAIAVSSGGILNLCDCGSGGTVSYASGSGIVNNGGTVRIYGGTVSGSGHSGVRNNDSATTYIYGGTVSGGYGVFQKSDSCKLYVYGGTVSGNPNDIHNNSVYAKTYLSGTPTVDTIYTEGSYSSNIYASDSSSGGTPYSGSMIALKYSASSLYAGGDAVQYVTDTNQALFQLDNQNYTLEYSDGKLKIKAPTYNVTLELNGGAIDNNLYNVTSYTYGTAKSLPSSTRVSKSGYNFGGWYEDENFTGNAVTAIAAGTTGDKTYYAKWIEKGHDHPVCGASCTCGGEHSALTGWKKLTFANDMLLVDGTQAEIENQYGTNYYKLASGNYYLDQDDIVLNNGIYVPEGNIVTLCLNGNTLNTGGKRNQVSGTLNITDCQTTAGKTTGVADNTESLLYVPGGTVNLYRVELSGNETGDKGGAVYISNAGKFNMYSGSITDNKAADGGGVALLNGEFNMYGGTVSSNEATGQNGGGGVYVTNGTFSMYGGTITGNTASNQWYGNGGGVYVYSGSFKVSGDATVTGNTGSNIMLAHNRVMTAENLVQGASFGVSTQTFPTEGSPVTLTGSNNADYSAYFFADNASDYEVANDNGVLKLQVKSTPAPATYTVTVTNDGHGTGSASPATAEVGTQIALTAIPDTGYQFKEWQVVSENATVTDNKFTMPAADVTVKAIFEANAPVNPPATYTVTFNANGGSGTMNAATGISGDYTLPACTFTAPAGKQFKAWSVGGEEKAAGAVIAVSADITVTALWEDISCSITGSVTDTSSGTATVKLMQGNTEVKTATVTLTGSDTNYTGMYSFTGVAPGVYNIVVTKDDVTMTVLVIVASSDVTVGPISMPSGSKNSVLDNSQAGDFAATVGGLDKIAANENIQPGQSVEIKLTVKAEEANNADPEQTAIKAQASGKTLKFIDLSLTKQIDSDTPIDIGDSNAQFLTIVIPFDTNKQGIMVYRYHGSQATAMTKDPTNGNEGFTLGNGFVTIYAKNFSTYAIGYTVPAVNPPSGGGGDYTPTYAITVEKAENGEVKANRSYASSGSTVTITVDPETGYVLNKLTVTDERGSNIEVTDKGDGTFTFKMPGRKVTVEASFAAVGSYSTCPGDHTCPIWPYTDAETTAWYHDGVHYCIENGLMSGYGDGIFKPNADTTRAMITVMLWRLNGSPVVNDLLDFEDVEEGQWYTEAIRWAKSEGIAEGYGNGYFGTNDAITREQMVTILWRYAQYKGIDVSVGEDTNILSYNDAFDVAEYAIPAMQWACGSGMVQGKNDPNGGMILDPESNGTRAQIATMMMRFCTEIVQK